jgi:hypothetical protein
LFHTQNAVRGLNFEIIHSYVLSPDRIGAIGTTWMEQCVLSLLVNGQNHLLDPANKNAHDPNSLVSKGKIWPEAALEQTAEVQKKTGKEFAPISTEQFDSMNSPRVIKSHAPCHMLLGCGDKGLDALPSGTKIIVVSRNPLDACVSMYYHAVNPHKSGWPFEAWASAWLSGNVPHGSWFAWVSGWYEQYLLFQDRVLWVQYEDVVRNPREQVTRLANFLDLDATEQIYDEVVRGCSFDTMKAQAADCTIGASIKAPESGNTSFPCTGGSSDPSSSMISEYEEVAEVPTLFTTPPPPTLSPPQQQQQPSSSIFMPVPASTGSVSHMRKGIVGDWRSHFTECIDGETGLIGRYRRAFDSALGGFGLQYDLGGNEYWVATTGTYK